MTGHEKDEIFLTQILLLFETAALQQMGKLKHPVTDAIERDLQQAQNTIDILDLLHRKMQGNLTPNEERLFTNILRELRLNYVDEAAKGGDAPPPATPPGTAGAAAPGGEKGAGGAGKEGTAPAPERPATPS